MNVQEDSRAHQIYRKTKDKVIDYNKGKVTTYRGRLEILYDVRIRSYDGAYKLLLFTGHVHHRTAQTSYSKPKFPYQVAK